MFIIFLSAKESPNPEHAAELFTKSIYPKAWIYQNECNKKKKSIYNYQRGKKVYKHGSRNLKKNFEGIYDFWKIFKGKRVKFFLNELHILSGAYTFHKSYETPKKFVPTVYNQY